MELKDLNKGQLYRLHRRMYEQLPEGGMFGWDWRTLRISYPSKYLALRSIAWAHDHAS